MREKMDPMDAYKQHVEREDVESYREAVAQARAIGDAAACVSGDNVSISVYNYGVTKREFPEVVKILKADPRFSSVIPTGFMGYIEFRKVTV